MGVRLSKHPFVVLYDWKNRIEKLGWMSTGQGGAVAFFPSTGSKEKVLVLVIVIFRATFTVDVKY